jgi:TRAP-type C4-dicarboxylate transport system substrate-binding protein
MQRIVLAAVITASALSFGGSASAAELWQGYTYLPSAANVEVKYLEEAAKVIGEATRGQIRIRVTPGGGLPIKADDIAQAIADDVIQYGQGSANMVAFSPISGLARVPGLYANMDEYRKAAEILTPYIKRELESKGIVLLGQYDYPEQTLFGATDKLQSINEMKGLKVRVSTPSQAAVISALGGVPITVATPEVAPALQQGRVDAVITANAGGGRLWIDMLKVNYRLVINYSYGMFLVNKKRFDALPADQKAAVARISAEAAGNVTRDMVGQETDLRQGFARDKGMKVAEASAADIREVVRVSGPIWEDEARKAGPDGLKVLAEIRRVLGK